MHWGVYIFCFIIGAVIGVAISMLVHFSRFEGVCCGPRAERRIDVAYPPGIRIGLTGPWTRLSDPLDRSFFDGIQ